MMNNIIYVIYNLIYQVITICILFYANTFLNWSFIPNSLQRKEGDLTGVMIAQILVLIIEAVLLMLIIYFINKWYLVNMAKVSNPRSFAMWTAAIYAAINITMIIFVVVSFYR
jgi:hypothetical protein